MGATTIDYQQQDFVQEIRRLTGDGVDAVFDPLAGSHLWVSRKALRRTLPAKNAITATMAGEIETVKRASGHETANIVATPTRTITLAWMKSLKM